MIDATVIVALIGAVAGLITTGLQIWQRKRIGEVHAEVKNSHTTNLRDDMDLMHHKLDYLITGQRRHDDEISGLRDDLRQERKERLALAARVDS